MPNHRQKSECSKLLGLSGMFQEMPDIEDSSLETCKRLEFTKPQHKEWVDWKEHSQFLLRMKMLYLYNVFESGLILCN